jgi:hypothetical protein
MYGFWESGTLLLIAAGIALVAGWTARRSPRGAVVLALWALLPLVAISAVTSKLYHYAFPFLPPLALMGAYAAALVPAVGWAPFDRTLERAYAWADSRFNALVRLLRLHAIRMVLVLAIAVSLALAAGSLLFGRVQISIGSTELASAGVLRPGLAAFVFGVLLMPARRFRRQLLLVLVASLLPLQNYRDSLALLGAGVHPRRSLSTCIQAAQAPDGRAGGPKRSDLPTPSGLRVEDPIETISHSIVYYFEPIQPWVRGTVATEIPALVRESRGVHERSADLGEGMAVTLPPAYAACAVGSDGR